MKIERKLNKMYAGAIALMMVSIIFASVFATRTFTDSNDTWTGTIVQSGNLDFKSGAYFNLSKKIVNSKGHVYNATGDNIQIAIWDLNGSTVGKTVWLPGGVHSISTIRRPRPGGSWNCTIRMEPGVILRGVGINSTILKPANGCGAVEIISAYNCHNFTICDLTIDGNEGGVISTQTRMVGIDTCKDFTINNICFRNPLKEGIHVDNSHNGTFDNIYAYDVGNGNAYQPLCGDGNSHLSFASLHIKSSGIKADTKNTFGMDWGSSSWMQFTNTFITGTGMGFKLIDGCNNFTFNGLTIDSITNNTQNGAINLGPTGCYDINFNNVNIESAYQGVAIGSTAQRINFNNIIIHGGVDSSFYVSGDFITVNNAQLYDGNFGLFLYGCDDSKFSNIEMYSMTNDGIEIENCDRDNFVNCKFTSNVCGLAGKTSTFFTIADCIFTGNSNDAIDLVDATACNNFTITNCIFTANGKAIDIAAASNYFIVSDCICQIGDGIDINAALSNTRRVNDTICVLTVS